MEIKRKQLEKKNSGYQVIRRFGEFKTLRIQQRKDKNKGIVYFKNKGTV